MLLKCVFFSSKILHVIVNYFPSLSVHFHLSLSLNPHVLLIRCSWHNYVAVASDKMSKLIGNYTHVKNENLDEYYQKLGIPFIARKIMSFSSPKLTITNEGDQWTITTSTSLRTLTVKFKLGEEYEEDMPKGALKSVTTLEDDNTLKTVSAGPGDVKITRVYTCTDEGCVLTLKHEESGVEGKRYFKRI